MGVMMGEEDGRKSTKFLTWMIYPRLVLWILPPTACSFTF